jgi:hypothetical protein
MRWERQQAIRVMLKTVIFAVVGALVPSVVIAQQDAKLNADNSVSAESKSAPFYGKDFDLRFNSRVPRSSRV